MKNTLRRLLPLLALCLVAAAKTQPEEVKVRFYTEGVAGDVNTNPDPVYLVDPTRKIYRSKIASISEHEITSIYPFQTTDGSIGCVFILNSAGRAALDALSIEKRGSTLTAEVNGRMIINLAIDRRVSDGILVIPHGMTPQEGLALKSAFKVVKPDLPTPPPAPSAASAQ